jgi:hypothetical protein
MTRDELCEIYRGYIDCLNRQDWDRLGLFVDDAVEYNRAPVGLAGYRGMLEDDFRAIPDLRFRIELLISDPPHMQAVWISTAPRAACCSTFPSMASASNSQKTCSMNSPPGEFGKYGRSSTRQRSHNSSQPFDLVSRLFTYIRVAAIVEASPRPGNVIWPVGGDRRTSATEIQRSAPRDLR